MQTTSGVDNHDIETLGGGFAHRATCARHRVEIAGGSKTRTPAFPATTFNCAIAAGRLTSVETSSGCLPCPASHFANLPAVVVLPAPCRPSSRTTRGRFCALREAALRIAKQGQHLVAHDLDDLLRRREARELFGPSPGHEPGR